MKFGIWTITSAYIKHLAMHSVRLDEAPKAFEDKHGLFTGEFNLYFKFEGTMYRICQNESNGVHKLLTTQTLKKVENILSPSTSTVYSQHSNAEQKNNEFRNSPRFLNKRPTGNQPFLGLPRNDTRFAGPK
jgi:hypothetical protein